jgi:hypothetical protein
MVARGWECERVPSRWKPGEQDAGDHKGPPLRNPGADHEFSQNNLDTGPSTEGRSIGHVRDQSAPTGGWMILVTCISGGGCSEPAPTAV